MQQLGVYFGSYGDRAATTWMQALDAPRSCSARPLPP